MADEPINRPPVLRVAPAARAEIGEFLTDSIVAFDPDGDDVVVRVGDGPDGFGPVVNGRGRVIGFEWEPLEPGEWDVTVSGTDPDGLVTEEVVRLVARHPRSVDLVLAMGDSLAAGFGRDRSDFLGDDACYRSERDAYGLRTAERLVGVGSLPADAEALLVACSGVTVADLAGTAVAATAQSGEIDERTPRSQRAWAEDLNPTIITLTVGASDVGLWDAEEVERFVRSHAVDPSTGELAEQLDSVEIGMADLLERLTTTTDAHIALTTYFDPTPTDPVGVDGCEGECFAEALAFLYGELNERIVRAAGTVDTGRVSVVRLDGEYDIWEAGNALGPDGLRDGLGPLQGVVDRFTGGAGAACADDSTPAQDLVSSLDCRHPNESGHERLAARVVDELLSL